MNTSLTVDRHTNIMTFIPEEFIPLSFDDFVAAERAGDRAYNVRAVTSEVQYVADGMSSFDRRKQVVDLPINFNRHIPIYALVEGGWLPLRFVDPPYLYLDRNVVGSIQQIAKGNSRAIYSDTKYWLEMLDREDLIVSPFLYAFESNQMTAPDLDQFIAGYEEAVQIIGKLFSKAQVPVYDDEGYKVLYGFVEDVLAQSEQETLYLLAAVPLIRQSVAPRQRFQIAMKLFELGASLGIKFHSLPFIATLSCLYEDYAVTGYNAARDMLKIKGGDYSRARAYNALSDMRGLVVYLAFRAINKQNGDLPFAYCTGDKAALLFGCGYNGFGESFRNNQLYLSFNLSGPLFPNIPEDERLKLFERIASASDNE